MSRPVWLVTLLKVSFPGRYLLARATRLPLLGRLFDRWLFAGDDIFYLPKDHVVHIGQPIEPPESTVLPSQVVEHFIEQARYHWIMNFCICREAEQCQDYPRDLGCLFLGEAVLGINPKLGRLVTKEEALEHVRRCRQAGLVHLIGRNKLDTVWLGVGPGERLLTICNCCPCCCLWRILPHVSEQIERKIARMPGVTVSVTERCVGCGRCAAGVCFVDAIHMRDGRAEISDACRGCGRCADMCPSHAIEVAFRAGESIAESIARISSRVDVT